MTDASIGRRPRGIIKMNGQSTNFLGFEVQNQNHFSADEWHVELEAWQQKDGFGLSYWADASDVQIEILMGFLTEFDDVGAMPSSAESLLIGQVDNLEIDPITGNLRLSGRDLTAKLIDAKTTEKYPDAVSSYIVTQLAQKYGFTPDVTQTKTPAGQYYANEYASLSRDIPVWDLIVFLAQAEGFDAYVTGNRLYFGPPQADQDAAPYSISIARDPGGMIISNVINPRLRRSLTLAQDISVTVLSHSYASGKSAKATATRAGTKAAGSSASKGAKRVQNYTIRRPNLTQEQAQQVAESSLAELSKFERLIDFSDAGDPGMSVRRMLQVSGTGTSFDQKYYIQSISQSYRFGGLYKMDIRGKNHPTSSDATI